MGILFQFTVYVSGIVQDTVQVYVYFIVKHLAIFKTFLCSLETHKKE